jgi:hypothetical protein
LLVVCMSAREACCLIVEPFVIPCFPRKPQHCDYPLHFLHTVVSAQNNHQLLLPMPCELRDLICFQWRICCKPNCSSKRQLKKGDHQFPPNHRWCSVYQCCCDER